MAYDRELAERIRAVLADRDEDRGELVMFGGLGFLVNGHVAVAAWNKGSLMARIDPAEGAALAARAGVEPMVMREKPMAGWLLVDSSAIEEETHLREWVDRGVAYVRSLPPKRSQSRGRA